MKYIPQLFQSKKYGAALFASVLTFFAIREGFTIEQVGLLTAPFYAFILGQGIADHGKSRAEIEAVFKRSPRVIVKNIVTGENVTSDLGGIASPSDAILDFIRRDPEAFRLALNPDFGKKQKNRSQ